MAFGIGVLRLSPDAFWRMTFPELRAAARGYRGEAGHEPPPSRAAFSALMQLFPDRVLPTTTLNTDEGSTPWRENPYPAGTIQN